MSRANNGRSPIVLNSEICWWRQYSAASKITISFTRVWCTLQTLSLTFSAAHTLQLFFPDTCWPNRKGRTQKRNCSSRIPTSYITQAARQSMITLNLLWPLFHFINKISLSSNAAFATEKHLFRRCPVLVICKQSARTGTAASPFCLTAPHGNSDQNYYWPNLI